MTRAISRIEAALAQLAPEIGPIQCWILSNDGFARCGDLVITEHEFMKQSGCQDVHQVDGSRLGRAMAVAALARVANKEERSADNLSWPTQRWPRR
jgi:hypothetical protein